MDDIGKQASSYQLDQEILDARGIDMTVEEVAGLPTTKYSERVHSLQLSQEDLLFLKGLRRRIKNRLASQNSRRRNLEHLRRLTRELRAVRACRDDALAERLALVKQRDTVRDKCQRLRDHVVKILQGRADSTSIPSIEVERVSVCESQTNPSKESPVKKVVVTETKMPLLSECFHEQREREIFQCRIDKIVQQSVNHLYKNEKNHKVFAKTVFISNENSCITHTSNVKTVVIKQENVDSDIKDMLSDDSMGVLNLSVKQEKKRTHGRKQSAPKRITYVDYDNEDVVLDLKIKKEPQ